MTRIFLDQPLCEQHTLELPPGAANHVFNVLRMRNGDALTLFNGDGHNYAAAIIHAAKRSVQVQINSAILSNTQSNLSVHLGQVISKGDRMDFTVQKATELGVSEITPLWSERCDVRLKAERLENKMAHWEKVIIASAEQSGRTDLPVLHSPRHAKDWVEDNNADVRWAMHPFKMKHAPKETDAPASAAILVGPEGGLTEQEVEHAVKQGFETMTLGKRVLRTETASLAALSVLQYRFGDF